MSINPLTRNFGKLEISDPMPLRLVEDAHADDIHGLIREENSIISGSKDGEIKRWTLEGDPISDIFVPPRGQRGYRYWITALCQDMFEERVWAAGFRDGTVQLYFHDELKEEHSYEKIVSLPSHVSKPRNQARINCITSCSDGSFLLGLPTLFCQWNRNDSSSSSFVPTQVHSNDWVYCINPLAKRKLAIVTGANLSLWERPRQGVWKKSQDLIVEEGGFARTKNQRPHISSLATVFDFPLKLAAASFDGSLKIVDPFRNKIIYTYREHRGRAWSVVVLEPSLLATGADDHTIKLWDLRQPKSAATLPNHIGRVSSLLVLDQDHLVAGSCPDDLWSTAERAQLIFWDLKKI